MKTLITLVRCIAYVLDGPVSVGATITSANPLGGDPIAVPGHTLSVDQPEGDWSDDAILAAFKAKYPDCDVVWDKSEKEKAADAEAAAKAALEAAKNAE